MRSLPVRRGLRITLVLCAAALAGCASLVARPGTSATLVAGSRPTTCGTPVVNPGGPRQGGSVATPVGTAAISSGGTTQPAPRAPGEQRALVAAGTVQLRVTTTRVGPCDSIAVVVSNGLSQTIYVTDHHSSCTILTVELQASGTWQPIENCTLGMATRMVPIAPGATMTIQLTPGDGIRNSAWQQGTYRVTMAYSTSAEAALPPATVTSAPFTIQ